MNTSYRDPKILEDLYVQQGLSQQKIAARFGVHQRTISVWMQRHQIPVRDCGAIAHTRRANRVALSQDAISFIQGHLLGDGSLLSRSQYSARYSQVSKYYDYAVWLDEQLKSYGMQRVGSITKQIRRRPASPHKDSITHSLATKAYVELKPIWNEWYVPRKSVPKDFVLDKISLLQWYMDDGHFVKSRMSHGYLCQPEIYISNFCFPIEAKKRLAEQMERMGISTTYTKQYVRVRSGCTDAFFNVVGPCPVPRAFSYKWPL